MLIPSGAWTTPLSPSPPQASYPHGPHLSRTLRLLEMLGVTLSAHSILEPSAHPIGSTFKTTPEPLPLPALLVQANIVPPCPGPVHLSYLLDGQCRECHPQLPAAVGFLTLGTSAVFSAGSALASQFLQSTCQASSSSAGSPRCSLCPSSPARHCVGGRPQARSPRHPTDHPPRVRHGPSGPRTTPGA